MVTLSDGTFLRFVIRPVADKTVYREQKQSKFVRRVTTA